MSKPKVIVTIPALNEEKTIGGLISRIHKTLKGKYNYEIQVVDDGSTDRTAEISRKEGAFVVSHPKNYGLAKTFNTEMENCISKKADIIVHIDADEQYLPEEIPRLISEVEKGSELVLGSRFLGKIESMPLINRFGNLAFSKVLSSMTKTNITDAQTGFRAFTRNVAEIKIHSGYTYTHEQLIRSERKKFKISEVPITAKKTRKSRLMKSPLDYAIKAWITLIRLYRDYEPLKFFGMIGIGFVSIGFLTGLFLVYTFINTGIVGHIPLTILTGVLILVGIQTILFGFLADMIKK